MQKNHCLRVARWLRTVQNVPTNYHMASTDRLIKILPFTEGPMVKYFLYYKLSFYEMIYIKYLVKRYFKD